MTIKTGECEETRLLSAEDFLHSKVLIQKTYLPLGFLEDDPIFSKANQKPTQHRSIQFLGWFWCLMGYVVFKGGRYAKLVGEQAFNLSSV